MKKIIYLAFGTMLLFISCVDNSGENTPPDNTEVKKTVKISSETINQIVKSIPPPVELISLIKESGLEYNKDLLNATSNSGNYSTTHQKSLNLGVYGADLGYINMYEKTYASVDYLSTIRSLANDLELGQFFDVETLKRLSKNKDNIDSITYISTTSFEKMNNYLSKQKRENISVLMLVGGWIESIYLATMVAEETGNKELIDRVGEQKISLDQISILMKMYEEEKSFSSIVESIQKLKKIFDDVKVVYEYSAPVTKEVNGMLVVESDATSRVEITKEQFDQISDLVKQIRNELIKQ